MPEDNNTPAPPAYLATLDDVHKGHASNKGWDKLTSDQAAAEAIKAHRQLESHFGVPADRLVKLPSDANDKDGWNKVHTQLGRPADEKGYDLQSLVDGDTSITDFQRKQYFELGIPKKVAEELNRRGNAEAKRLMDERASTLKAALAVEQDDLRKSWGSNFNVNMIVAKNALTKIGFTDEQVKTLESVVGYRGIMESMHKLGLAIGEDAFVRNEIGGQNRAMSREGAMARINELKKDPAWVKRYLDGDAEANRQMTDLHKVAHPSVAA